MHFYAEALSMSQCGSNLKDGDHTGLDERTRGWAWFEVWWALAFKLEW